MSDEQKSVLVVNPVKAQVDELFPDGRIVPVCQMLHWGSGERTELQVEMLANKIAAAPELLAVAKAYERWEADLILCDVAWVGSTPRITQQLWDRFLEIQAMRNKAIAKAEGESK